MKDLRYGIGVLDAIDLALLQALSSEARLSIAALARRVGLSAPSVSERLKRLEEMGVIEGYVAQINPRALGYHLAAWLRIRPIPGQLPKVAEIVRSLPQIVSCDRVTGEDCFIARALVRSVEDLESLIDKIIPYATINTSIIQSSPVEPRLPPFVTAGK
ncbi:MAG: Lrp/AsnC family transcriptional regulator [Pseudomonadota bacterium]